MHVQPADRSEFRAMIRGLFELHCDAAGVETKPPETIAGEPRLGIMPIPGVRSGCAWGALFRVRRAPP
jgi:hypothetical protein